MSNTKNVMGQAANTLVKPLNVEEVFSTYLYEGTGSTITVNNGIDLDGEGGLVWTKNRSSSVGNNLTYTDNPSDRLVSDTTAAADTAGTKFNYTASGYTVGGNNTFYNSSDGSDYVSWTFRKAPKFFDIVTWTGDGTQGRTISHNLGSVPGCIIVKNIDRTQDWAVYHRGNTAGGDAEDWYLLLNQTSQAADSNTHFADTAPTSTEFTVGTNARVNENTRGFVAYLFAHNDGDGGFGPDGDADIIKCGSYTGTGIAGLEIDLGFEPQWFLMKRTDTAGSDWFLLDVMRGFDASGNADRGLRANTSGAESNVGPAFRPIANGVEVQGTFSSVNANNGTYIYIAIRRGPMAVPESATDVFDIATRDATHPSFDASFPVVDAALLRNTSGAFDNALNARLTGTKYLETNSTGAEQTSTAREWDHMDGWSSGSGTNTDLYSWMWRRAPNFFDVVNWDVDGTGDQTIKHSLGVVPEMVWSKNRNNTSGTWNWWVVTHKDLPGWDSSNENDRHVLRLNTNAASAQQGYHRDFTSTSIRMLSVASGGYTTTDSVIAYLFATLAGVSKVGSYTGDGTTGRVIDCGFTSGARFVLTKRTNTTGNWNVWDTERGIVAGNDPRLELNDTTAEDSGHDYIDPDNSGFIVNYVADDDDDTNVDGDEYIFYAIA